LLAYAIAQTLNIELEQQSPHRKSALKILSVSSFFRLIHAPNFAYINTFSFVTYSYQLDTTIKKGSGKKYLLREIIAVDERGPPHQTERFYFL
jgi:hypothetical protein